MRGHRRTNTSVRIAAGAGALALVLGTVALIGPAAAAAPMVEFTAPGEHEYLVPAGVTAVRIDAIGGRGADGQGGSAAGAGGRGGEVSAIYLTAPGTTLYAVVGANGAGVSTGGGGTSGGSDGGRGGGASDVRVCSIDDCQELDFRILVAAGGGGGAGAGTGGERGGDGGDAGAAGDQGTASTPQVTRAAGGASGDRFLNEGGSGSRLTCDPGFAGANGGPGGYFAGAPGNSAPSVPGGSGGAKFGGGGGGGAGLTGAGGGGGGGAGYSGGGGGGGGGYSTCRDNASGGGGGGGGTNFIKSSLNTIANGTASTTTPLVRITPLNAQSLEFTSAAPDPAAGDTYRPAAEATSGLPVTITVDTASDGVCSISAGIVTFLTAGVCVILADQPGNDAWGPAEQRSQRIQVGDPTAPALAALNPPVLTISKATTIAIAATGSPQPTISVAGALPNGVDFVVRPDGTGRISGVPEPGTAGEYPITIRAQNQVATAEQQITLVVVRVPSSVELTVVSAASEGEAVTIGIDVTGGDPPSGTVELSAGTLVLGAATLDADGHAQLITSALPAGRQVVAARYGGDRTFAPSAGSATIDVAARGGLASTGTESTSLVALTLALLAAGAVLVVLVRRRPAR